MFSKLHSEITVVLICLPGSTIISKVFTPKTFAKYIIYVLRTPTLGHTCSFSRNSWTSLWESGPLYRVLVAWQRKWSNQGFVLSPGGLSTPRQIEALLCCYFKASAAPQLSTGVWQDAAFYGKAPWFQKNICMKFSITWNWFPSSRTHCLNFHSIDLLTFWFAKEIDKRISEVKWIKTSLETACSSHYNQSLLPRCTLWLRKMNTEAAAFYCVNLHSEESITLGLGN